MPSELLNFKIGDRIVDEKHPEYKLRVGTVVAACRTSYPGGVMWDDGCCFDYEQIEFDRMRTANCGEQTIKCRTCNP